MCYQPTPPLSMSIVTVELNTLDTHIGTALIIAWSVGGELPVCTQDTEWRWLSVYIPHGPSLRRKWSLSLNYLAHLISQTRRERKQITQICSTQHGPCSYWLRPVRVCGMGTWAVSLSWVGHKGMVADCRGTLYTLIFGWERHGTFEELFVIAAPK